MTEQEIIEKLMETNEEFRSLKEKHAQLEERLEELQKKVYLTVEEEVEVKAIKRQKLELKDKMNEIISKVKRGEIQL
ncbi:conserved hypothetical protein [Thermosulfidibacter takaii ABI70S6]|uniref:DUF465 domain-containing protein n=1 Tax=Thermosulfidibacter takaii (strain DSM 17441 / JCM 13301 / NBRC 103674 / ABI70S6) TaxID=1298851 RepID=A0A0S3QUP6_THET7|nr:YdcH family protein [Thermosulfidibacter takaii]BAT72061.1 conserved hypothetical protein [Thermosulfidibacter takaii ABI70S6]